MPFIKINPDGFMAMAWLFLVEMIPCENCRELNRKLRIISAEHYAAKAELAKEMAKWSAE